MNTFIDAMSNTTYTENGAITNISTKSALLDFFFHGAALRKANNDRIINLFQNAFNEDKTKALKILFYIRDIRGGQGERNTFRVILEWLAINEPEWLKYNLSLIPEYGRWDDFGDIILLDKEISNNVIEFLSETYYSDLKKISNNKEHKITLLGKWLWSENATSLYTKNLARILINSKKFGSAKEYRKNLVKLRKAINIVETKLCNREYENIDYSKLPSLALLKYRSAFRKNDEERYTKFLSEVNESKTKINTSTLYPYDIVRGIIDIDYWEREVSFKNDETLETQWKNLPDYVPEINGLVVFDTSGSMNGLPMEVSLSLALYIAERNKSEVWKNHVIPFSSEANFITFDPKKSLKEKLETIYTGDCSNTNLQSVFELILNRAEACQVKPEDMPKVLIIVSDMEFDGCHNEFGYDTSNIQAIREKYKNCGYDMPKLVWWNVDSRNTQTPATIDDENNILLSGCSPAVLQTALNGNMFDFMENVINKPRYEAIKY